MLDSRSHVVASLSPSRLLLRSTIFSHHSFHQEEQQSIHALQPLLFLNCNHGSIYHSFVQLERQLSMKWLLGQSLQISYLEQILDVIYLLEITKLDRNVEVEY